MLKEMPHLKNINSDPMLSGTFKKGLKHGGEIVVGQQTKDFTPDVKIKAVGIT